MLSQTSEYALRAVVFLAERGDDQPVRAHEIGAALGIPANYLSKTLHTLVRSKVLASVRGPAGGFRLAVAPKELTLLRVVEPFDPDFQRRTCLLGRAECSDRAPCRAHHAWKKTAEHVTRFFQATTVADLARRG